MTRAPTLTLVDVLRYEDKLKNQGSSTHQLLRTVQGMEEALAISRVAFQPGCM